MSSKLCLVAHTCNLSTGESKARGDSREFKVNLGYGMNLSHYLQPRSFPLKMALTKSKLSEEEVLRDDIAA